MNDGPRKGAPQHHQYDDTISAPQAQAPSHPITHCCHRMVSSIEIETRSLVSKIPEMATIRIQDGVDDAKMADGEREQMAAKRKDHRLENCINDTPSSAFFQCLHLRVRQRALPPTSGTMMDGTVGFKTIRDPEQLAGHKLGDTFIACWI